MDNENSTPDLSGSFPRIASDVKIKADLNNPAHSPHFDVLQAIPGGTVQVRVTPDGDVLDTTVNVGKAKL